MAARGALAAAAASARRGKVPGIGRLSLRARVVAIAMALVAVALVVTQTVLLGVLDRYLTEQVDRELHQAARLLSIRPIEPNTTAPSTGEVPERRPRAPNGLPSRIVASYLTPDGSLVRQVRAPGAEDEAGPKLPVLDQAAVARLAREAFTTGAADDGSERYRVIAVPLADGTGTAVVAQSLHDVDAAVERMRNVCLGLGAGCLVVLAVAGWFAVRAGLRPLRRIEQTAAAIAAGDLSHRVPAGAAGTEIGRLSAALNGMLAQIETAFEARAQSEARMLRFVADAGHELRTPLSSVRGFAELHRLGGLRSPAEVDRMMRRIEDEAARMTGLVEDLLQLARLDEQRPLRRDAVDLRILAADALDDIRTLAPSRPVSLTGPDGRPAQPTEVSGDEPRLRQVVANLVSNALRHTPEGTAVDLTVGRLPDGTALLEVRDHGEGLSASDAKRVFERFYRVDSSRSRGSGGGSGLGLAIVAALVQAHDGTVTAGPGPDGGAAFRVVLPAGRP
ncbi:sensor histidine kinase [Yinghuangia soli]|uniref:histidine kinase n=1 Tax=Yinghuangia soli TaxID=2908204 RepID=A0AA41U557_9ACTN|nr:HAMP domain-containing sensor histidine kinase [Yinghuangia soli]MCF2533686.1 HAMP domain-containing histidine kinase [Yinghuangia soli]